MAERVSWVFSPDRKAVLVVADPVGVENEPVPNGFFFGDEARGFQTQVDSVWDVAVSPDWKWIGFGRAYAIVGGEGTGTDLLTDVARRTSIDTATLRAGSFASSGMSMSRAVAQPGVIRIPDDPRQVAAGDSAAPRLFPIARGWQRSLDHRRNDAGARQQPRARERRRAEPDLVCTRSGHGRFERRASVEREACRSEDDAGPNARSLTADRHDPVAAADPGEPRHGHLFDLQHPGSDHDHGPAWSLAAQGLSELWVRGSPWRLLRAGGTSSLSRLGARRARMRWRSSRWFIRLSGRAKQPQLMTTC